MCDVFKALASTVRLNILAWLKEPATHFPASDTSTPETTRAGVCVGYIQRKAGLSASTASTHLAILQRAGLVEATRIGQWTYYKRNETAIQALAQQIHASL